MLGGVRAHYIEAITSASYLGMLAFVLYSQSQRSAVIPLVLVAAISLFAWAYTYKRVRTIADIATSRIGSAAQGYVELYGRASVDADNLIKSPLSGIIGSTSRGVVTVNGVKRLKALVIAPLKSKTLQEARWLTLMMLKSYFQTGASVIKATISM